MKGLKISRDIEEEIQKISDSGDFYVKENTSSFLYKEKLSELDKFYDDISKILKSLDTLIIEMKKKIETKDESKGKWEM